MNIVIQIQDDMLSLHKVYLKFCHDRQTMSESLQLAWTVNKVLPEFLNTSTNANEIVQSINDAIRQTRSSPLKIVLEELFMDNFHIPSDIIDIINVYEYGTVTYHYAQTFEKHIKNTIYITPIIFGYIESVLFISLFIIPSIIESTLTPLLIIYGSILLIHGILALISYHKCSKYELFIRNFKQSLHNNDKFFSQNMEKYKIDKNINVRVDGNESNINENENEEEENNNWSSNIAQVQQNDPEQFKLINALSNPSNNTFAYIAYQRWLNVKNLELSNDKFTRSRSALALSLSKYLLPSGFVFAAILFVYANDLIAEIWCGILIHICNGLGYCYFRVAEGSNPNKVLKYTLIYVLFQDIFTAIILVLVYTANEEDNAEYWLTSVAAPIFYGLAALLGLTYLIVLLKRIYKWKNGDIMDDLQIMWLINCMTSLFLGIFFAAPEWTQNNGLIYISIPIFMWMMISYYMCMQQLIERIMTGIKTEDYIAYYMANQPQIWLKNEIKWLFKPNQKLFSCLSLK